MGTVIGHGGYQPPEDDLDNNGVLDLLEVGSDAVESTVPLNDTLTVSYTHLTLPTIYSV